MSLMRRLQDRPHLLERSYRLSKGVLKVFSRRRRRPDYPGPRPRVLYHGVDFKWSQV